MSFWEKTAELSQSRTPFVVITLISSRGHAPQDPGAKAIVTQEGLCLGTVGGGKVEKRAIEHAKERLARTEHPRDPELLTWNLQRDIGMTCGGEVTYLFELHSPWAWPIAVFGAGHVSQALVRLLGTLDCQVICADARAEWVEKLPKLSNLQAVLNSEPASLVSGISKNAFFVVMTQGHATDVPILEAILKRETAPDYVGVIGSETKGLKIRHELKERGVSDERLKLLRCPIGLALGGNAPAEIAVSIVAELLQVRDQVRLRELENPNR